MKFQIFCQLYKSLQLSAIEQANFNSVDNILHANCTFPAESSVSFEIQMKLRTFSKFTRQSVTLVGNFNNSCISSNSPSCKKIAGNRWGT